MTKTKQTAVEWLIQKIYNHPENPLDAHIEAYFKEAKEMEKENTIAFADKYDAYVVQGGTLTAEQYYNETYGGNK
jgi:hypothetical protein